MPTTCQIRRALERPRLNAQWDCPTWAAAVTLRIEHFHPQSSSHRPVTHARLLYDSAAIHVAFQVRDEFVKCEHTEFQSMVCNDSCVEFFVRPRADQGYLNFEFNCGGTLLVYYIEDATQIAGKFRKYRPVEAAQADLVRVATSLPKRISPERTEPVTWCLQFSVPFEFFEQFVGPLGAIPGQEWRGNLFKCASRTSQVHWASWAPIGPELNFHRPEFFAPLVFDPA